jgi:hypothetical protein
MLLHLGSFSSHILPDLFQILDEEGFEIVTLEEAQKDPATTTTRRRRSRGGTLTELGMRRRRFPGRPSAATPRETTDARICN